MCGISGCITSNQTANRVVIEGINKLKNRGYDSCGLATVVFNELIIKKYVSECGEESIKHLNNDKTLELKLDIMIGHTRWATHGAKTLNNAHPHHDDDKRFAVVHNGIIENYTDLKIELMKLGYLFYSETDTEVVVKYLHNLMKNGKNYTDLNQYMRGSWAILIIDKEDPDKICFLKNGSPLLVGFDKDRSKIILTSELVGFDDDITMYYPLADGDYGYVSKSEIVTNKTYNPQPIPNMKIETSPSPYPHWTIKEIHEQPHSIDMLLSERLVCPVYTKNNQCNIINFPELENKGMENAEHIIFLACGTSLHAAQVGLRFFKEFRTNATIEVIDGGDFEEIDMPVGKKTVLVLLSQSGETRDLKRALDIGKKHSILTIGIINVENSLIAREVDVPLYIRAGRENAVASTKSFTNQTIMLLLIALWINDHIDYDIKLKYVLTLKQLSTDFYSAIQKSLKLCSAPVMMNLFEKNNCFVLGKHQFEWVAREGALKIKEISYIHAEGFSAIALKHGPFALLEKKVPVIIIANNDQFFSKIENAISEIKSRFASIILITNKNISDELTKQIDQVIHMQSDPILFPTLSIVPLQILAYYLSLNRGINPDYPRNLAKVVTVE